MCLPRGRFTKEMSLSLQCLFKIIGSVHLYLKKQKLNRLAGGWVQRIQAMQATITTVRCGKDKESNSAKVDKKPYKSDSLVS